MVVRWGYVWASFGFRLGVRLGIRLDFDVATFKIRFSSSLVNAFEISFNTSKFVCRLLLILGMKRALFKLTVRDLLSSLIYSIYML